MEFLRWEWVIFFAPLLLAVLIALSSVVGMDGQNQDGEFTGGGDAGDVADAGNAILSSAGSHTGHGEFLSVLGVGKAPLSLIFLCLLLVFSVVGLIGNSVMGTGRIAITLVIAFLLAVFGTGFLVRLFARYVPSYESYYVTRTELVGSEGVAIYPITQTSGTVRLHDRLHTQRQLDCRTYPGEAVIPENRKVIIMDYDAAQQIFFVRPVESALN